MSQAGETRARRPLRRIVSVPCRLAGAVRSAILSATANCRAWTP